jgi:hypothetical protein
MTSAGTSKMSVKRIVAWSGVALAFAAVLIIFLLKRENPQALTPGGETSRSEAPIQTQAIQAQSSSKSGDRKDTNGRSSQPTAVMAKPALKINGLEDLLAFMREGEIKRTKLLATWRSGTDDKACNSMVFLIDPPTEDEYNAWQEVRSQLLPGADDGKKAEMKAAADAMDKGFAFGDTPMYVKVLIPEVAGKEVSIMSGLVGSENSISYNDDGSVSVRNLQKFKLMTTDRITQGSRFGHLVDFGGIYQPEE